jgi:hypothetical protein
LQRGGGGDTTHDFGKQRLDEVQAVAIGNLQANKYKPLYNNTRANVGARSSRPSFGQHLTDRRSLPAIPAGSPLARSRSPLS